MNIPIHENQLDNPDSDIVDIVTRAYQADTFLYSELNKGSWN